MNIFTIRRGHSGAAVPYWPVTAMVAEQIPHPFCSSGPQIVKIDTSGNQTVWAYGQGADALAFDASGLLWVGNTDDGLLGAFQAGTYAPNSPYVTFVPQHDNYWGPSTAAFDYKGNLWSSDYSGDLFLGGSTGGFGVGTVSFSPSDSAFGGPAAYLTPVTSTPSNPVSLAFSPGYTTSGFTAPIVNPPAINAGKAGRTYPVKWAMKNPDGSIVTALSVVRSTTYQSVTCGSLGNGTSIPLTTTAAGNSSLRYDSTANQFIYDWATPPTPGCYELIVTLDSQQTLTAFFNLN